MCVQDDTGCGRAGTRYQLGDESSGISTAEEVEEYIAFVLKVANDEGVYPGAVLEDICLREVGRVGTIGTAMWNHKMAP